MKKINKIKLLKRLNRFNKNTLMNTLKIKYINIGKNTLTGNMFINRKKLLQPIGYLHGGAIVSLAESIGSTLSNLQVDYKIFNVFNIEFSINHIKSIKKGILFAKAKIIHKGKTLHLIKIHIYNEYKKNISFCKMTNIIILKKKKNDRTYLEKNTSKNYKEL
ncbi:PaaI family thioesterase [Blattabacterium cuenoti]|uniref:PaaI family thioesterase n=1 Tax=Blattabacterium cuenoti TaxID=1653831 RepID=UPI00163CFD17|nr:PaaI family thioesterase [Blattabacterium cuenoti]